MKTERLVHVWECTHCGQTKNKEEEVYCWNCGIGEMVYRGKFWEPAAPVECPTRWEVIKENLNLWWKKYAGDPDDPNGLGINLLQTIFWAIVIGIILAIPVIIG
jgi:hypothetical protein